MALLAVMSVDILMVVMMVAVLHHGCRGVDQFWICMFLMSIYVFRLAVDVGIVLEIYG